VRVALAERTRNEEEEEEEKKKKKNGVQNAHRLTLNRDKQMSKCRPACSLRIVMPGDVFGGSIPPMSMFRVKCQLSPNAYAPVERKKKCQLIPATPVLSGIPRYAVAVVAVAVVSCLEARCCLIAPR
jgi:hypothetical protein